MSGVSVAVYVRISKDSEGRAENVATQEERARAYAAERWPDTPVRVFADNDISAATGAYRPGLAALMTAVRAGEVSAVVCAEQSRLTRVPAEWETLMVAFARAGIEEVHTYRKGVVTFGQSKLVGRLLAAVDAEEVEVARTRIREKLDALAAEGRPAGGSTYGYRRALDAEGRKILVVDDDQAKVVREIADRVLAGWSLGRIAKDLTDRGVPTARGGRWAATTVRSLVTKPGLAGFRVHRGEIVGRGNWEPILDEATWRRTRAVLESPLEVVRSDGSTYPVSRRRAPARSYLLSGGIAVCGRCGANMVAQRRKDRRGMRQPSYTCSPAGGCAGVSILALPLEAMVEAEVIEFMSTPSVAAAAVDVDDGGRSGLAAELATIEGQLAELASVWAAGGLSAGEWQAARAVLLDRQDVVAAQLAAMPGAGVGVDWGAVAVGWPQLNLDEKRHLLRLIGVSVRVLPARPGVRRFDTERVAVSGLR